MSHKVIRHRLAPGWKWFLMHHGRFQHVYQNIFRITANNNGRITASGQTRITASSDY